MFLRPSRSQRHHHVSNKPTLKGVTVHAVNSLNEPTHFTTLINTSKLDGSLRSNVVRHYSMSSLMNSSTPPVLRQLHITTSLTHLNFQKKVTQVSEGNI